MPLLVRYPPMIDPGSSCDEIVANVDFAPPLLKLAGVEVPATVQGRSFVPLLTGDRPDDWPQAMYYRYWMHNDSAHGCPAHYGIRTKDHKLICYYNDPMGQPGANGPVAEPQWELFDLRSDRTEVDNLHGRPEAAELTRRLTEELDCIQRSVGERHLR